MGILKMGVKWEGLYTRETKRKLRRGNYFHDRKKGKERRWRKEKEEKTEANPRARGARS